MIQARFRGNQVRKELPGKNEAAFLKYGFFTTDLCTFLLIFLEGVVSATSRHPGPRRA